VITTVSASTPSGVVWQAIVTGVIGAVVGIIAGALSVLLEKVEKLEEEEVEERKEYEAGKGEDALPWKMESYGWTWIERWLSPLAGAALFGIFAYHQGWNRNLVINLVWVGILLHVSIFDVKHRLILNRVSYPAVVLAFAAVAITPDLTYQSALIGAVTLGLFFFVFSVISRGGMGMGDAKLAVFVGAITGFELSPFSSPRALLAAFYGVMLGGVVTLLLLITRIRGLKDAIPYGPFICLGAIIVLYQTFPAT
jgi:prepilin signal peptidase PulO-like enzyme (type II secretory pathway)